MKSDLKFKIKLLSYYQIFGGMVGLILVVYLIAQTGTITGLHLLIFSLATILYANSIYCGRAVLTDPVDKGLTLSKVNQALQTIYFSINGYGFKYISGGGILASIDYSEGLEFHMNLTASAFLIDINNDHHIALLGFNILAIYLIYYIVGLEERLEEQKLLEQFPLENES